jgi:hypothetical protein
LLQQANSIMFSGQRSLDSYAESTGHQRFPALSLQIAKLDEHYIPGSVVRQAQNKGPEPLETSNSGPSTWAILGLNQ